VSDTAASQPDLNRIAALLNTMDRGALAIALCERSDLRVKLTNRLRPLLTRPLHDITLTEDASDPLEMLRAAGVKPGEIAIVSGLEAAGVPALQRLEWSREAVWKLGANLLFWVTGEGQRSLLREAPNFYSRRTLLAQFTSISPELLTLLYLDLVGSDQLMQDLGDEAFKLNVLRPFANRVCQQVGEWQGEVVTWIGTAALASFREPALALRCSAALQQRLAEQPIPTKSGPLRARASLHSGRPVRTERTLVGIDVIRTARLSHLAEGGHVLVSAETHALVSDDDLPGLAFVPQAFAPERRPDLRGVFELLWEGQSQQSVDHGPIPTNLPPREALFAGRTEYLERLAKALPSRQPLLLTGPGGIGKTSLALEVAHSAYGARRFPGGVVWLRLEENPSLDSLISTLAQALDVAGDGSKTLSDLYLSADLALRQAQCLLVLDGAEGAANQPVLWNWLNELPETVSLLATARQPFVALDGAKLLPVDQLSKPDAAALLIRLARQRTDTDWNSPEYRPHLERIAELCGGHPLALQIAAGFAASLPPAQIATGLEQTEAPATDAFSLRTFEWAYRQLDETSRRALAAASLFVDPFTAEALAATSDLDPAEPVLALLEATGMLRSVHRNEQERYELHPLIGEFAARKLAAFPNTVAFQQDYVDFYCSLLRSNHDINNLENLALLNAEWRNVLAATQTARQIESWISIADLSGYLGGFFLLRGLLVEWSNLNALAIEAARLAQNRAAESQALNNSGAAYNALGRLTEAENCFQESLAIKRECGDRAGEGRTLNNLGIVYQAQSRLNEAENCFRESLIISQEHGDRSMEAQSFNNLGVVYYALNRLEEAECCYKQGLTIYRECDNRIGEGMALGNLGITYSRRGLLEECETSYRDSLTIFKEFGDRMQEGQALENLALLHADRGRLGSALSFERKASAVFETTQDEASLTRARKLIATWEGQIMEKAPAQPNPDPAACEL